MTKITAYKFGKIVVDGQEYQYDIIIIDGQVLPWQRQQSHLVILKDIEAIVRAKPSLVIFGTGAYGVMMLVDKVIKTLEQQATKVMVLKTKQACQEFNKFKGREGVAAALHLTC